MDRDPSSVTLFTESFLRVQFHSSEQKEHFKLALNKTEKHRDTLATDGAHSLTRSN